MADQTAIGRISWCHTRPYFFFAFQSKMMTEKCREATQWKKNLSDSVFNSSEESYARNHLAE